MNDLHFKDSHKKQSFGIGGLMRWRRKRTSVKGATFIFEDIQKINGFHFMWDVFVLLAHNLILGWK